MSSYKNDKRLGRRMQQEFVVGVKTDATLKMAYTIDVSRGGIRVGSPQLLLPLGGLVELVIEKRGNKYPFSGRVARDDGMHYIDRISRSAKVFFIRIDDPVYLNFAIDNYFV